VAPLSSLKTMLREGDAAMAMALTDHVGPDIEVEVLGETGFCCLMPEDHPLAREAEVDLGQLVDEQVISYRPSTRPRDELEAAARRAGLRFTAHLEIDSSISALGFVQAGLGVAVVDSLLPWDQFAGLVNRPLANGPSLPLSLLTPSGKTLSRAEELMRAHIRAICANA